MAGRASAASPPGSYLRASDERQLSVTAQRLAGVVLAVRQMIGDANVAAPRVAQARQQSQAPDILRSGASYCTAD